MNLANLHLTVHYSCLMYLAKALALHTPNCEEEEDVGGGGGCLECEERGGAGR